MDLTMYEIVVNCNRKYKGFFYFTKIFAYFLYFT